MVSARDIAGAFAPGPNLRRIFLRADGAGDKHLAPLDGLRALALVWVIFCHAGWYAWADLPFPQYLRLLFTPWMLFFWRGDFAVEIFFVMSGFLIGGMIADEHTRTGRVRIGAFYARRLFRLWPALVVAVFVEWIVIHEDGEHELWPNIFYVNNFLPILSVRMGWTWSLAIEEQFYLVVPWLLAALRRLQARAAAALGRLDPTVLGLVTLMLVMIGVVALVVSSTGMTVEDSEVVYNREAEVWARGYDTLYSKPWMRAGPILVGLMTARLWRIDGFMERLGRTGWLGTVGLVLAFFVGLCAMHWQLFEHAPRWLEVTYLASYRTVFGLMVGYGMLLVLSKHSLGAALGRFLSWPVFYPMANLAYCAYLLNPVVAMRTHAVLAPMTSTAAEAFWLFAAADLVLTFTFAVVLSVLVERPFMELRRVLVPRS